EGAAASESFVLTVQPSPPPPPPVGRPLRVSGAGDGAARQFGTSVQSLGNPIALFPGFAGEVRAATGDFNGDRVQDTVLMTGPGTETVMAAVSGKDGSLLVPPADPFRDRTSRSAGSSPPGTSTTTAERSGSSPPSCAAGRG